MQLCSVSVWVALCMRGCVCMMDYSGGRECTHSIVSKTPITGHRFRPLTVLVPEEEVHLIGLHRTARRMRHFSAAGDQVILLLSLTAHQVDRQKQKERAVLRAVSPQRVC